MPYLYLALAIVAEVIATSALKASEEFSRLGPTLIMCIGYLVSFYFLTLVLRTFPIGIAYAVWSGLGIVLVSIVGYFFLGERLDGAAIAGIAMIVGGVLVIRLFSATAP